MVNPSDQASLLVALKSMSLQKPQDPGNIFLSNILEKLKTHPRQILLDEGYCKWFVEYHAFLHGAKIFGGIYSANNVESICNYSKPDLEEGSFMAILSTHLKVMFKSLMHRDQAEFENVHIKCRTVLQDFKSLYEGPKKQDHLEGSEFLLDSLTLFSSIVLENQIDEGSITSLSTKATELFRNQNAKAVIIAGKRWFLGDFVINGSDKNRLEVEIVDQILELDPNHWEWNLMKYKVARWHRRTFNRSAPPENQELIFLTNAYDLNPTNSVCLISVCQYLAEFLKGTERTNSHGNNLRMFPLSFGELIFQNCQEIVHFLKEKAIEYKENFPNRSNAMNEFGKIFSSDLPPRYRDRPLAKACLELAIRGTTMHSKFLHRMGIFLIQEGKFQDAQPFLEKAMEVSPTNAVALIDLLYVYMTNLPDNSKLIRDQLPQLALVTGQEGEQAKFLMGYIHAKFGEEEQAVKSWMDWVETCMDMKIVPDFFRKLSFGEKFLEWPRNSRPRILQEQCWIQEIVQSHPQRNDPRYNQLMETIRSSMTQQTGGRGRSTPIPRPVTRGRNYRSTQSNHSDQQGNWRDP